MSDELKIWTKRVLETHNLESVISIHLFLTAKLFVLRRDHELGLVSHDQIEFEEIGGLKLEPKVVQHVKNPLDEKFFTFIHHFYVNKWCVHIFIMLVHITNVIKSNFNDYYLITPEDVKGCALALFLKGIQLVINYY